MRWSKLAGLLLLLLGAATAIGCDRAPDDVGAKHFILISVDTLRRDHVSAYGYERDTTPNLRVFADSGVAFDFAFAANTNTAPSHASMLTGLHPHRHGIRRNGYKLNEDVVTLAQRLGKAYRTGAFVSGYPLQRMMTNLDRGFGHYDDEFGEEQWQRPAEATIARVQSWLESSEEDGRPLFLFVHLYDPHHPYDAPEPFARRFLPDGQQEFLFPGEASYDSFWEGTASPEEFDEYVRRYDGEIAYADDQIGRLFDILRQFGFWDEAAVLVTSDHGETLDERAAPFAHGSRVYDEQVRVPFLLRLPGDRHAGTRVAPPVHHVDVMPTILDLLGKSVDAAIDGESLRSWIGDGAIAQIARPMFSTALPQTWRVPEVEAEFRFDVLVSSLRTPTRKLVAYPGVDGEILQLFDLERDPGESNDEASHRPAEVAALREELESWRSEAVGGEGAPRPELTPEEERGLRALGYLD